ncbi:MAG: hypothetical protein OXN18_11865 [Gemmatimonadota bacterium]|nr:hypothetical protein [Gemmatimonadota bacterium]
MKNVAAVLAVALAAAPLSAQGLGGHLGLVGAKHRGDRTTGLGILAGLSYDFHLVGDEGDDIRAGVFYVQKGNDCCHNLHYVEIPVLYKFRLGEIPYVLMGPAAGYLFHYWDSKSVGRRFDLGAVALLGIELRRFARRVVMFEVGVNYGLLDTTPGLRAGDRANRAVAVGVRLQNG